MDVIKRFGLIISILMILMAYLKQAIPHGRATVLMKTIISLFILISMVDGIRTIDFEHLKNIFSSSYSASDEAINKEIEDGLMKEYNSFLMEQGVEAKVVLIELDDRSDTLKIKYMLIIGSDINIAKPLLSARYQIEEKCIEVKNE